VTIEGKKEHGQKGGLIPGMLAKHGPCAGYESVIVWAGCLRTVSKRG
jgi:hypothetical protein